MGWKPGNLKGHPSHFIFSFKWKMHLNGEARGGGEGERGGCQNVVCFVAKMISLHPSIKINKSKRRVEEPRL